MTLQANRFSNTGNLKGIHFAIFLAIPTVIFLYFLQWKTHTMFGDDLYIYKAYSGMSTFSERTNLPVDFGKYRPVHGISMQVVIDTFRENVDGYYIFNVLVQSLNVILFALIANLFLQSAFFSLCFGMLIGLSRFSFFNITQLINGGMLEGMSISFFLASLYFMLRIFRIEGRDNAINKRDMLWAILFANLSMYNHERYLVLLIFQALFVFLAPSLKPQPRSQKWQLLAIIIGSLFLNALLKKFVFSMTFFMGTASTEMEFSLSRSLSFLWTGLQSLFMVNRGDLYLVGAVFSDLPPIYKLLCLITTAGLLLPLLLFIRKQIARSTMKNISPGLILTFLLGVLFALFLAPAVSTFRLEQRWLQASFCILMIMLVVSLGSFDFPNRNVRNLMFSGFILIFLVADRTYLSRGAENIYIRNSHRTATIFSNAVRNATIGSTTNNLFIILPHHDINIENDIRWTLADGYLFELQKASAKKIIFVDSVYQRTLGMQLPELQKFDKDKDQIIFYNGKITDLTKQYSKDSLKYFNAETFNGEITTQQNDKRDGLMITADNIEQYHPTGFHNNEGGMRWTDGNASIQFDEGYRFGDSLQLLLKSYTLKPNVHPRLSVIDANGKNYSGEPGKPGDGSVSYRVYVDKDAAIKQIHILSETFDAKPDQRKLSVPFLSLEIKKIGAP